MRGLLSLDQELRAVRRAKADKGSARSNDRSSLKETDRPWQSDIEQIQDTMREVLRAVAGFSGVELPGLPSDPQVDNAPVPRLDIRNLKDRFRHDLEGFSIKTTEEVAKRAREETRAALEAVQNEVGGMVDEVAAEFRENLQLPAQIEKLLEPCVEDAEARLESSISQKFEQLVAHHEQLVQDKLQGTLSSVHAQMSALEQAVQQIRELKAESAAQSSGEQPAAVPDVEQLLAEHDRVVQGRLQEALGPLHAQMSALEQTVQQVREQNADAIAQSSVEQPNVAEVVGRIDQLASEFQEKLRDQAQIESLLEPRIGEAAARLEKSICEKVENLVAKHEQLVQEKLQGTLDSVQTQIRTLERTVQQIRDLKAESDSKLAARQPVTPAVSAPQESENSLDSGLKEFLDQSFSRIECSFNDLREVRKVKSAQSSSASLEYLRQAIPSGSADMLMRVQQALDHLDELDSKDPHPAS